MRLNAGAHQEAFELIGANLYAQLARPFAEVAREGKSVFLSSPDQKTVPVGVTSELIRGDVFFWGPLMAGALLGSIPVAIVYSFFVEHYVSGLTGSVKG